MGDADKYGRELALLLESDESPSLDKVLALITANADVNWNGEDKLSEIPLILASDYGHVDVVKALLSSADILINKTGFDDNTALMAACDQSNLEIVKLLLAAEGIDINYQVDDGYTALMVLVQYNTSKNLPLTKFLLDDARTNIHLKNSYRETAREQALHEFDGFNEVNDLFKGEFLRSSHRLH
jgi:ankyrin repeat protein